MMDELISIKIRVTHESVGLMGEELEGSSVKIGGIVENYEKIFTKKRKRNGICDCRR